MLIKGDLVTFFSLSEDLDDILNVKTESNINWFVDNRNWYTVIKEEGPDLFVKGDNREMRIRNVFQEYQVFTPDSLRKHLTELNTQHSAICNKIKQLYRKQEFKFKYS